MQPLGYVPLDTAYLVGKLHEGYTYRYGLIVKCVQRDQLGVLVEVEVLLESGKLETFVKYYGDLVNSVELLKNRKP